MPALGAKLRIPTARRELVARARLTGLLPPFTSGEALTRPRLVLVAAPAGFGKTTLLTQWLTSASAEPGRVPRIAWLSLDAEDSDLRRFLSHLVAATQAAFPGTPTDTEDTEDTEDTGHASGLGDEAVALLENEPVPAEDVLASFINDLDAQAGPTVVALDDYHVINNIDVHQALNFLVANLPPQVTIAIATRADPPLPVARLRARGELVEVRAADLRFTHAEAGAFLNEGMGLQLSPDLVTALGERTEGWAVGLQLAALSARSRGSDADEVAEFVESFSGSHRFVLDYLLEEVLGRQPEEVRTFLLETSVLQQLTAGVCNAVTGRTDSQTMLERLETEGLFVVGLDEERRWFRYHHLFGDALRARLSADHPGRVQELHAAAARWLAGNGLLTDAVHHALAGNDHEYAADLIELGLGDQRRRRQDPTLREWAARLDEDVVRGRPLLATFVGWSRLAQGDVDGVEPWLDAAESGLDTIRPLPVVGHGPLAGAAADREAEVRELPSMIAVYRAAVAQARGDTGGTVAHARRALDLAGPADHFSRGAAAGFIGQAAWAAGDLDTAVDTFSSAVGSLEAAGMRADALGATVVLAQMWLGRGEPQEARNLYEDALAAANSHPGPTLSTTGDLYVGLADVLREQGELDAAEENLQAARALGDRASLPENRHRWFTTTATLRRAHGDLESAAAMLDRAEQLYLPGYFPDLRPIPATRARVWVAMGRLGDARGWANRRGLTADDPVTYLNEYDLLTLARLLTAEGAHREAVDLLDRVVEGAHAASRHGSIVEARLIRALAHHAAGDTDDAVDDMAAALALAAPGGYCRLFLDEGPMAVELLTRLADAGTPSAQALATQLLNRTAAPATPGPTASTDGATAPDVLGEGALSDRELEVLRLLATELSGPDIARRLFVSVNTLRTHTKHIYTKLDVNTRRAAVRRATELHLL